MELIEEEKEEITRHETQRQWDEYEKGVMIRWTEKQQRLMEIEEVKRIEKQRIQQVIAVIYTQIPSNRFTLKIRHRNLRPMKSVFVTLKTKSKKN